jgi:type IV pilus assembly protein PilW
MNKRTPPKRDSGFTLVELMVSMAIGLLIVLALVTLLVNVNRNNSEMSKTNRQIENGRFAIQLLENDLIHAGFWGSLPYTSGSALPAPTAAPDPCVLTGWDVDPYKTNLLGIPVQGYADGSALSTCGVNAVSANSDILLVRHANTCIAGSPNCDGGADTGPHIQVSNCRTGATPEAVYAIGTPANPASAAAIFPLKQKNCSDSASLRKVVANIYYLTTSNNLPTLMRVALVNGAYSTPQPLIEGIEAFRVEYGIDDADGDGSADTYVACPAAGCTLAQLANVVSVKVHVLARNLDATPGYTDGKAYQLGATTVAAANDGFKRHVYSTTVRLVNPSGRREAP